RKAGPMGAVPPQAMRGDRMPVEQTRTPGPGWRADELFAGLTSGQFSCVRSCLRAEVVDIERHDRVLQRTSVPSMIGVLIAGTALDTQIREDGSTSLVDVVEVGDLFGDGWDSLSEGTNRAIVAASPGRAILLDSHRLIHGDSGCSVRPVVVENFLRCVMKKHHRLREHFDLVTRRSLRERLSSFLLGAAERNGYRQFTIPISRAELASFLNADRTAVSRELARMRDESLISFHRNSFALHDLIRPGNNGHSEATAARSGPGYATRPGKTSRHSEQAQSVQPTCRQSRLGG
ncbi:MAG: Crp/Fnr family transcriptional regulator, partial [Brevibacterium aurantiacum]